MSKEYEMETLFTTRPEPVTEEERRAAQETDNRIMRAFEGGADVVHIVQAQPVEDAEGPSRKPFVWRWYTGPAVLLGGAALFAAAYVLLSSL